MSSSGLPPVATWQAPAKAGSAARPSRASTSCAAPAADRGVGDIATVRGSRSRSARSARSAPGSSGRVLPTTSTGWPSRRFSRKAMKRREGRSHQCRSSTRTASGPVGRQVEGQPVEAVEGGERGVPGLPRVLRLRPEERGGRRGRPRQQALAGRRVDQGGLEQLPHHAVRELALQLAAAGGEDGHAGVGGAAARLRRQPRLADAGLPLDEQHPGLALGGAGDDLLDLLEQPVALHEYVGAAGRGDGHEAPDPTPGPTERPRHRDNRRAPRSVG